METFFKVKNQRFSIKTFGCKLNTYDTGFIEKSLHEKWRGSVNAFCESFLSSSSVYILNTCAVTEVATLEAVKWAKRLRRKEPSAFIVITGCAAQVDTDHFLNLIKSGGVDLIVANSHKAQLVDLIQSHLFFKKKEAKKFSPPLFKSNIFKKEDLEYGGGEDSSHTRSFLKIQDGCNSFCTFCIIPFARGKSRSVPVEKLVQRVNELYNSGVKEVVLTGVHIGDYKDRSQSKERGLEDLVEALLKSTKMPRFRLSSLEPIELSSLLLDLYKEERLCPHFHMSIQSAEDRVLKSMKRQYGALDVERSLNLIHKHLKQAFVGMDVIVGFPGETNKEFEETYTRLKSLPWTRIHVFPYSLRKGTMSARRKDHLPQHDIKRRAKKLRALSSERYWASSLKQTHSLKKVLCFKEEIKDEKDEFEKRPKNSLIRSFFQGLSRDYWKVKTSLSLEESKNLRGQEVDVLIHHQEVSVKNPSQVYLVGSLI